VARIADVLMEIVKQTSDGTIKDYAAPITKDSLPSSAVDNPYRKLFDAIATASSQPEPAPIPAKLFHDCLGAAGSPGGPETMVLKSIRNVVRSEEAGGKVVYEFDVDGLSFIQDMLLLITGDKKIASEVIDGLFRDPRGPQVDLKQVMGEYLSEHVKLTCKFHADGSLDHLMEIGIKNEAAFLLIFQRLFETEPSYLANGAKDFYVLTTPTSDKNKNPQRLAGAIFNHHFVYGTLDMVEAMKLAHFWQRATSESAK
jgi:hypothetical protein